MGIKENMKAAIHTLGETIYGGGMTILATHFMGGFGVGLGLTYFGIGAGVKYGDLSEREWNNKQGPQVLGMPLSHTLDKVLFDDVPNTAKKLYKSFAYSIHNA